MAAINPISVNTQGIGSSYGFIAHAKPEEKKAEAQAQPQAQQQTQLSANDVLGYMAQSAVAFSPVQATKTINPANYVDSASAARIGEFMSQFEDTVAANLSAIAAEFPSMSESASIAVAAGMTDSEI